MILTCPDCAGFEDRPYDLCAMCSDPGVAEEWCPHERFERFNQGCDCTATCHSCGASLESDEDECWSCGA
jgi:hypothetical protein